MEEQFLGLLNKTLNDELSAVVFYKRAAAELIGPAVKPVADELAVHADEEMQHFNMLMGYASNYDLLAELNIQLDSEVANFPINGVEEVITKVQELEAAAVNDYEALFGMAKELKDFTGVELFRDLLEDEIGHYDDLAYVLGQTRDLFQTDPDAGDGMEDGITSGAGEVVASPEGLAVVTTPEGEVEPVEALSEPAEALEPTEPLEPLIESAKTAASVLSRR